MRFGLGSMRLEWYAVGMRFGFGFGWHAVGVGILFGRDGMRFGLGWYVICNWDGMRFGFGLGREEVKLGWVELRLV